MATINCTEYEKNEFIRILEYAREQKRINRPAKSRNLKFDTTDYDIERINVLIGRVNGNYREYYHKMSTKAEENKANPDSGLIKIL